HANSIPKDEVSLEFGHEFSVRKRLLRSLFGSVFSQVTSLGPDDEGTAARWQCQVTATPIRLSDSAVRHLRLEVGSVRVSSVAVLAGGERPKARVAGVGVPVAAHRALLDGIAVFAAGLVPTGVAR